ncbi:Ig-like domain-containing protein [Marivirga salinae]|uniref:Ig-like domain-containing protein n=1 Tax=Marivirga salinarum TaxID=3059078 RepID=A0AA51REV8_9BACT|nr:Ig-like domain-containing protein [Marivirga sp. BDSF4-3]WMN12285.1 Ig-like domain-containing protein [Marivirga sp. BDSF4-3]
MNTRKKWFTASFLALIMTAFMISCVDENVEQIGICPEIVSTDPENLENSVNLDQMITITFNGPMDPATISEDAFTLESGSNINGRVIGNVEVFGTTSYNEENYTMSFTPDNSLLAETNYTATVGTTVKDKVGNALPINYVWQFNTGKTPVVIATNPVDQATNVPLNQVITVKFNQEMDAATITASSFIVSDGTESISGQVAYSDSTASFTPDAELTANLLYTATITTTAGNTDAISLVGNYSWEFTAGTKPEVIETNPLNEATNVAINAVITADFSQNMNPLTINASSFTISDGTDLISGQIDYSGVTASFIPENDLVAGATYMATITNEASSADGVSLESNYTWEFTTEDAGLSIVETNPIDQSTDVPLEEEITAEFSEEIDPLTITSSSFTVSDGTNLVSGLIEYTGAIASFIPDNNLMSGTTYTVTITTDVVSNTGLSLENNFEWTFSTVAPAGPSGVDLQSIATYGIFAGVGISNNSGFSEIRNMNVGITPGVRSSITGFPPAIVVNGAIHASDDTEPAGIAATLQQAKDDLVEVYLFVEGATSPAPATVAGDLGGTTLAPGIYKSTSTLLIQSGDLTLDAQGDVNAVWIFQVASDFTTVGGAGGNVILSGGAQSKNVYWQTGSSATIGDGTTFKGNILALTSITMNSGAVAEGRMLARNGSVVMTDTNIIEKP